jgi:hypothetical protein
MWLEHRWAKTAVTKYYNIKGSFPTGCSGLFTSCNAEVGLTNLLTITGKYVAISASGGIMALTPAAHEGSIS